jgi:hypothetical protein
MSVKKLTDSQYTAIFKEASRLAYEAANEYVEKYPESWYPCGFSWVRIKPARGAFVSFLKKHNIGRTDDYMGGYVVYNPSGHNTQSMEAKRLGSRAFVNYLIEHLPMVQASVETRID